MKARARARAHPPARFGARSLRDAKELTFWGDTRTSAEQRKRVPETAWLAYAARRLRNCGRTHGGEGKVITARMRRDAARVLHVHTAARNNVPWLESGRRDTERAADTCRRRPTVPPPRGRTPLPSSRGTEHPETPTFELKTILAKRKYPRFFCYLIGIYRIVEKSSRTIICAWPRRRPFQRDVIFVLNSDRRG